MIKIKSPTQQIENAETFDIYKGNEKRAVRIIANEGFELIKENEEPSNIRSVDIPAMYEERINLYKAIPWVEIPDEPETPEVPEESETETQATETDYINALGRLGVNFNE